MPTNHFEDFEVGDVHEFGAYHVTEDEINEFSQQFDPGIFAVDPETVESSTDNGIASGWHIASMTMRILVDELFADASVLSSPGIDNLRWHTPVRPNDTLSVHSEVVEKTASKSTSDRGLIRFDTTVSNQDDMDVMSMTGSMYFQKRSDANSETR